jgi:HTH-type transcriptional regulator/antitoxin HigA
MITNERQYRITKRQLSTIRKALKEFNILEVSERLGSKILAESEIRAMKSEKEILKNQLKEYELLRSGEITQLKASNLSELPIILIRARIAQGLTQRELADIVGLKEQQIQRYESEEYGTASLRRMQNIATALKLNITEIAELNIDNKQKDEETTQASQEFDWSRFPVREMYKRHWFEGFDGSLDAALEDADNLLRDFIGRTTAKSAMALYRKRVRAGSQPDEYALLAWECRVLSLASKASIGGLFEAKKMDNEWINRLSQISERHDGPTYAKKLLEEAGIALIIEPHLTSTHLDGAALLSSKGPVIGMTLRYDRLDNFWFVLFHELFHIIKHLNKRGVTGIFDDLEFDSQDQIELEADSLAREALIPQNVWSHALARYVRSPESVIDLAKELHISPAIVAGFIRYEANNYVILKDLIGQGEVRKHFPEVAFGS